MEIKEVEGIQVIFAGDRIFKVTVEAYISSYDVTIINALIKEYSSKLEYFAENTKINHIKAMICASKDHPEVFDSFDKNSNGAVSIRAAKDYIDKHYPF